MSRPNFIEYTQVTRQLSGYYFILADYNLNNYNGLPQTQKCSELNIQWRHFTPSRCAVRPAIPDVQGVVDALFTQHSA